MKIVLVLYLALVLQGAAAQVGISYFPFQSVLAVHSDNSRRLWGEFKLETNTFFSNMNMEFSPKVNIKRREKVLWYLGPGISVNPFNLFAGLPVNNGYFLDVGFRVSPFSKLPWLQFAFEISPYVNRELTGGVLRTRPGVGWTGGKDTKSLPK